MFNPPPVDLFDREPLIYSASTTQTWYRSHRSGLSPIYFRNDSAHRWDAPDGEYGVLYLGADEHCAFMESIGRAFLKTRFVPASLLKTRELSKIRFSRELRLIDLVASGGLTRVGAEGSLTAGFGYRNSQRWSNALRTHPAKPDGIYYQSRYDPARAACAIYEYARSFVQIIETCGPWASQPALLGAILDVYGLGTDL